MFADASVNGSFHFPGKEMWRGPRPSPKVWLHVQGNFKSLFRQIWSMILYMPDSDVKVIDL